MYKDQIEGQRKKQSLPVIIKEKEIYKVEKILNKRKFRGKNRYLVQQKGYIAEEDTWEPKENLGNARDLVEIFEEEYKEESRQVEKKDYKEFHRGELPRRYTAKTLYGWDDRRFDQEYQRQLKRNWKCQKGIQQKEKKTLEMIQQEKEQEIEEPRIKKVE